MKLTLVVCALALAACETATPDPTDAPPPTAETTSTTSTTVAEEVVDLSYRIEPGEVLVYDIDMTQRLTVSTEGESAAADVPSTADLTVIGTGRFTYEASDGPREGTYLLTITGEFDDLAVEGTLDGEPIEDPAEASELGIGQPVAGEIVVDALGRPVEAEGDSESGVAEISTDLARFPGPVLSPEPVAIGERWEVSFSETALGSVPVETTVTGSIQGSDRIDGAEVLAVETDSATSEGEVDLSTFYRDFLAGGGGEPVEGLDDIVFRILVDPSAGSTRALLDPDAGRVIQSTREASNTLTMEVALPDETTGELAPFEMHMKTEQTIEYRLVDGVGS